MVLIAKSPVYRSKQSVPRTISGRYADLRPARAEGQAINRLGNLLVIRADEMKKEHDVAVVGELYNQWRDEDRAAIGELLQKKGRDAVGLQDEYESFYNESYGKADQQTENGSQQAMVRDMFSRRREQSLDILARYEATEAKRYKSEQEKGVLNNSISDARDAAFDSVKLENTLIKARDYFVSSNPGMSPEALEALQNRNRSAILFANMQARIDIDAKQALKDIEGFKEQLGEGYFQLKESAETKSREQLVEGLRNQLNEKYAGGIEPNFNKMEDDIQKAKIPDDIKDRVVSWIRSQETEYKLRESQRKGEIKDTELDGIFQSIRAGNLSDAFEATDKATELTQREKYRIENILKTQTALSYESNGQVYMDTAKLAMSGEIRRRDIIDLIGQKDSTGRSTGLSVADAENLLGELKKAQDPAQKELNKLIKNAEDAIEGQIKVGNLFSGYDAGSIDDAYKAIKEFEKRILDIPDGATIYDLLDPESQYYIVDDIVRQFTPSFEETIERQTDFMRPKNDKDFRKEGETPEQYLKRITQ